MRFKEVATVYEQIDAVNPKRLEIIGILLNFTQDKYKSGEKVDLKNFFKLTLSKFDAHTDASSSSFG